MTDDDFTLAAMSSIPDPVERDVQPPAARPQLVASPTRKEMARRRSMALLVGVLWCVGIVIASGLRQDLTLNASLLVHVGLPALLGGGALAIALAPGRHGLGPSYRVAIALAVGAPLAFILCALLMPRIDSGQGLLRGAFFCGDFGLMLGVVPLIALTWSQRRSWPGGATLRSVVLAIAIGLVAAAALGMHCSNNDGLHVALGHGWPVLVLAAIGAFVIAKRTRTA